MFGRPSGFGTQPNTFGFGTTASNTFGQSNQLFGSTAGGFNSAAPVFGSANTQPMFGTTPSSATPLFGTSNTSTFGQPSQTGFGSSLFGTTAQASSSGLFGTSNTTTFGTPNKSSGFGFPSSSGGGLFSQSNQTPQQSTSVFQSNTTPGLFGGTNTFGANTGQLGTVIKFVPVTGTDSVQKSGLVQSINTKHHCITCMKEYEGKSLEELRFEDYQRKNKGQQPFGQPQPFGIASTSSSIFGQPDKSTFGAPRTDFGTSTFGMATQTTTPNMFGKPATGFGAATSATAFPFAANTSSSGLFGSTTAPKPFAAPTNQMFGATQPQQNTFGNVFGQTTNQNSGGGIFGKPTTTGFNTTQSGFPFGTAQPTQTNLFQPPKPNTGFGIFGQTNPQVPTFGQQQQQPSFGLSQTFGKTTQPPFGQPTQSTFGTPSIFGNQQNKCVFGNTSGTSLFGNTFQQNTPFQLNTQQQQQTPTFNQLETQAQELRALVHFTDPYGYNNHLKGLSPLKPSSAAYVTNPKDIQKLLESPPPIAVVSPMNKKLSVLPISAKKTNLFDDMFEKETPENINFTLRTSAKRLVIRKDRVKDVGESPKISLLDASDTGSSVNITASASTLDIVPAESYKDSSTLDAQDSMTSLMTFNSNLIMDNTNTDTISISLTQASGDTITTQLRLDEDLTDETSQIDSCGVKLTRPEYYTVPPLDKLIEHKQSDGKCLVKGFTIGRVAYGNVSFPDVMDVSNLNLDELVHFRYREVTIYPDDSKKPPLGEGLNRRAQVTLDRVYPKSKMDRKLITDVDMLISINFSDTLRDLCEKHGTKFLDYRPETGSWVFMVDHFSKYAFDDGEEPPENKDNCDKFSGLEKQKNGVDVIKGDILPNGIITRDVNNKSDFEHNHVIKSIDDIQIDVEMFNGIEEDSLGPNGASIETLDFDYSSLRDTESDQHSLATTLISRTSLDGASPKSIFVMKSSLFDQTALEVIEGEDEVLDTTMRRSSMAQIMKRGLAVKEAEKQLRKPVIIKPIIFPLVDGDLFFDKPMYNPRNHLDASIFKGSSFKVGWGRGLVLVNPSHFSRMADELDSDCPEDSIANTVQMVDFSGLNEFDPFEGKFEEHLQIVLDTSDIVMDENNIPLFTIRQGRASLLKHQALAIETAKEYPDNPMVSYYEEIWNLCTAFWGPITPPTTRRDLFSTWLERVVKATVDDELTALSEEEVEDEEILYKRIFINLTGNRVEKAAELAVDNELFNLSLLLSQLNCSESTKSIASKQLDHWNISTSGDHIDPSFLKIYMLVAGQNVNGTKDITTTDVFSVCEDLDWKRCLAVMLWFISKGYQDITQAVDLFQEDFESFGLSARPLPPGAQDTKVLDILYHLMLLHCHRSKSLEPVLEPETHSLLPTDYRFSWLMLHTLLGLEVGSISHLAKTYMTTCLAQQLESMELYKWAIFVLLFIEDINLRTNSIKGVLYRNLPQDVRENDLEEILVRELCIPTEWIHEVKAHKSGILGKDWEAYRHFAKAGNWEKTLEMVINNIVPSLLINDHFDLVRYLLKDIEPGCRNLDNWESQGGLLLMFLDIHEKFSEKASIDIEDAALIHSLLANVCFGLNQFPTKTDAQFAGLAEIAKYCHLYRELLYAQIPAIPFPITLPESQLTAIGMPPDYQMEDVEDCKYSNVSSKPESIDSSSIKWDDHMIFESTINIGDA
ncbi:nuclear pore complex protein Nup98-Nup96 [Onthophagus taurus]|uniref:nuclear pore complex protein Nup98-Nup96 n=1 Tax=Onthophagus taurus TaxID=166361 RepID=UPI0039BE37BD